MREKLYTIPLNDAMHANEECPFCFIERTLEQDMLDFVLGSASSYMESSVRKETDEAGFCRYHYKKMFDYGNTLGNGWILKTHYMQIRTELEQQCKHFTPRKSTFTDRFQKSNKQPNAIGAWVADRKKSCYICDRTAEEYNRYLDTFFVLYKKDADFKTTLFQSKGFCLPHFGDLCTAADTKLTDLEKEEFFPALFHLMDQNMARLSEDMSWLIEKFDYRNQEADWRTSADAIQRGMQKLQGGYPADSVYQQRK
ncbi:MAG: DUF6062 family protein [Lachnospiraceae bacterium]